MRCDYCGTRVRRKQEVCKTCSAPVKNNNPVVQWGLFFAVVALVGSVIPVFNLPIVLASVVMLCIGWVGARKRQQHGQSSMKVAMILVGCSIVLTSTMVVCYNNQYEYIAHWIDHQVHSSVMQENAKSMLDIVTLRVIFEPL